MGHDDIIKEALSYDLSSDIHEAWRNNRLKEDGTYETRIKRTKDEKWILIHGTNEVDIANCSFEDLPFDWQYENLETSRVAINLVYDKIINGEKISLKEKEEMASIIHEEWLRRNEWVYDLKIGNPRLAVPYEYLSNEDKEKYKVQLMPAIKKIQDYKDGLINIDDICSRFNIN